MGYGSIGMASGAAIQNSARPNDAGLKERMPLIALEMDRQARALGQLHETIGDLEARLCIVLQVCPPDVMGGNSAAVAPAVPLAGNLCEQNNQIEAAIARLRSIFSRVEL